MRNRRYAKVVHRFQPFQPFQQFHGKWNRVIPNCSAYNECHVVKSFIIPQMSYMPDFLDTNCIFQEIIDSEDKDKDHKINLIRNVVKSVLE